MCSKLFYIIGIIIVLIIIIKYFQNNQNAQNGQYIMHYPTVYSPDENPLQRELRYLNPPLKNMEYNQRYDLKTNSIIYDNNLFGY